MSTPSPYSDLPEGCIRVLALSPGAPGSPLEARLWTVYLKAESDRNALSDVTHYEAISYCWGDTGFTRALNLGENGSLPLTESLDSALQSLRYADRSRLLWADAICINQSDVEERSAQVTLMGDIFAQADRVLVWLGPCSEENSEPLAFATLAVPLEAKGGRSRDELLQIIDSHLSQTKQCVCCGHNLGDNGAPSLADGLVAVAKLLERDWFERLWVVQEVALAKEVEVYCGTHHASWYNFVEIARVPGQDEEVVDNSTTPIMPRSKLRQIWARCNYLNQLRTRNRLKPNVPSPFRPTGLCNDLLMLSYLKCREPHDRIFGVSRVLGLQGFENLRPDYNLPVAELYRRTVELFLTSAANRAGGYASMMLALVGTETEEGSRPIGLPSWVPDLQSLSERSRAKHTYYQWVFAESRYFADASDFRCKTSTSRPNELLVRGRCYGTVQTIMSESCPSKHVHRRTANKCPVEEALALIRWYARCYQFLRNNDSARRLEIGEIISYAFNVQQAVEMPSVPAELMDAWLVRLTAEDLNLDLPDAATLAHELRPYITGHPCDRERHLGVVECEFGTSHAAWLPPTTQPGDKVCYFSGAPEPFVLREREDNMYELKGDAYVHGDLHHLLLEVDQQRWETLLHDLKHADEHLKAWMDSRSRTLLRANSDDMETRRQLSLSDQDIKENRQRLVDQIREVYRDADERFGWIRLR